MQNGNPPRHSMTSGEPKTIDLEAERVNPGPEDAEAQATVETTASDEAAREEAHATAEASAAQEEAAAAAETAPRPTPSAAPPSRGGSGFGLVAAGIVGGLVVLAGAGSAQYAGLIPNLGPEKKVQIPDYSGQIASLQSKLAEVEKKAETPAVDLSPVEDRLKALETAMTKLPVGDLTDVLAIKGKLDETAGKVSKFGDQLASVANRLQEAEATINKPRDEVDVARAIASAGLKAAIDRGGPFQAELQTLASVAPNDESVAALQAYAAKGVPSRAELVKRYPDAADEMLAVTNKPAPGQSLSERLFKSAFSVIKVRPVGDVEGTSPQAIVARIGDKLQNGDLKAALTEWDNLPQDMKTAGESFRASLEARVKVEDLVAKALKSAVTITGKQG